MKHIKIDLDREMGYWPTWVAYATCGEVRASGNGRSANAAVRRALKQLFRKFDHQQSLH